MRKEDAIYLAGLIDGEGCISVMRLYRPNRPTPLFMARISIALTSKFLINWVKRITKVGSVHRKPTPIHRKKQWIWMVNSHNAIIVINDVLPFLKLKGKQARNLLSFQSKAIRRITGGPSLSNSEVRLRTKYYRISRKLNGGRTRGKF
jgi:hypothetical protein